MYLELIDKKLFCTLGRYWCNIYKINILEEVWNMSKKVFEKLNNIDNKLDELQKDMEEIWGLLAEMKSNLQKSYTSGNIRKKKNKIIVVDKRSMWKRKIYEQIKILIDAKYSFRKRSEVLHYIYNYMRRNYGIVWEQDVKEYKEYFNMDCKPKTIDVVYNNETYRSIFEAILIDMVVNKTEMMAQSK